MDRVLTMTQTHDFAFGGFGRDLQWGREGVPLDDQRMVPRRFEWIWQTPEHAVPIVLDRRGFPVHQAIRPHHIAPEDVADALVAEADAQQWRGRTEAPDHVIRDACF